MFGVLTTGAEIAKNSADLGQLEKQTLFLCELKVFDIIFRNYSPPETPAWRSVSVLSLLVAIQRWLFG